MTNKTIIPPSLSNIAYIVAVLTKGSSPKPEGFRIASLSGTTGKLAVRDIMYDDVVRQLQYGGRLENAELGRDMQVNITQGSIKAYPRFDITTNALRGRMGLTVLYGIIDDKDNTIGYGVIDSCGIVGNISCKRLISLSNMYLCTNWEVYTKDAGDKRVRLKAGELQRVRLHKKAVVQSITSAMEDAKTLEEKKRQNEAALVEVKLAKESLENEVSTLESSERKNALKAAETEAYERYNNALTALENFKESGAVDRDTLNKLNANLADALKDYQRKCQEAREAYVKDSGYATTLPAISVTGLVDTSIHPAVSRDANKRMLQVANNLNIISPYYASMYTAIPKSFSMALPTMAVTEKEMLINPVFLMQLSVSEATFVYMHEMLHIALQHSARHGKKNNFLWNVACDIYINELILRDFGLVYGDPTPKEFEATGSDGRVYKGSISCLQNGCFLSTIGETLDFSRETAEVIYKRLYEENKDLAQSMDSQCDQSSVSQGGQGENSQGCPNNNSQGSQDEDQTGSQSGNTQGSQTGDSSNSQNRGSQGDLNGSFGEDGLQGSEISQSGQSNSQDDTQNGQSGQGNSQDGNTGSPSNEQGVLGADAAQGSSQGNQSGQSSSQGAGQTTNQGASDAWSNQGVRARTEGSTIQDDILNSNIEDYRNSTVSKDIYYKGKKMSVSVNMDITSNERVSESENPAQEAWGATREAITRIITKRKLDNEGKKTDFSLSSGEELVERSMDFALVSARDWRVILRKLANQKPKKTYTLTSPDRKLMNMGITIASRQPIGKKTKISGIKFAIDVSGSVTEVELNRHFTLIAQILDEYNIDAELIYWDTQITNVGSFSDLAGLLRVKPLGCGGTDPSCVFDYLMKRINFKGIVEDTPVKDISAVIIFTDGCFRKGSLEPYARYFGKKTIWVIDEAAPPFKPPFGVVAKDKLS